MNFILEITHLFRRMSAIALEAVILSFAINMQAMASPVLPKPASNQSLTSIELILYVHAVFGGYRRGSAPLFDRPATALLARLAQCPSSMG